MTASTVKSVNVTNVTANPIKTLSRKTGDLKIIIDKVAVTAATSTNEAGDRILFGPIPSTAVILDVLVLNDDLDAHGSPTLEGDWGLVYSGIGNGGKTYDTEVDLNVFADASEILRAATTSWTSVRYKTDDIADATKEAWEVGGLSEDPGGLFYLSFTVGTAAATGANGDIVVQIQYI